MNNPFCYEPDAECLAAFDELCLRLESMRLSGLDTDAAVLRELEAGKMLGVLVASDECGVRHRLFAFSGQLGEKGFCLEGFVEPVFDYLAPDGYFRRKEREISALNREISDFESGELAAVRHDFAEAEARVRAEVAAFKRKCLENKSRRDELRARGDADEAALQRESQFERAELARLKRRLRSELATFEERVAVGQRRLVALKERRRRESEGLQRWLFENFCVLNGRGESRSLSDIFAEWPVGVPPSGAGECCAPKLLQAAYRRGWRPESMAEFWYGRPKGGEVRVHGRHYPACRGKCLPVLTWMLEGLSVEPTLGDDGRARVGAEPEVVYENEWFCVVNKPGGMLSVPGKGAALSVQDWLERRYGAGRGVRMAHRLDQDTSGLILAAFGNESYKTLQMLFARRMVRKVYEALLEGDFESRGLERRGRIELPLTADWLDRPRQRVDVDGGKEAVTDYEFTGVEAGRSRVLFYPHTGRTHQLRVHAASASGLGMPIVGDRLYGTGQAYMCLHARRLEFVFPLDGQRYCFEAPVPAAWSKR